MKKYKISPTTSYVVGFIFSIILTLLPYQIVTKDLLSGNSLIFALLGYAVLQLFVQLVFFLHLGQEKRPRWKLISFIFTVFIVLMIVVGSIWIMSNLDYHSMPPDETDKTLIQDEGFYQKLEQN
jgi:cytochrome o ubiquinol oxidase subunit IV